MDRNRRHLLLIGLVALIVALFYGRVSTAWFCGYDDFNEAHRAAFADSQDPKRMLTTTHDLGYMYRPITSALQYATWNAFHHSPVAFRVRNLVMHLVSVAMLYGIVLLVTDARIAAAGAALLFGLHPMANETVVVGIWTNATAYALVLSAFFFFVYALSLLRRGFRWLPWHLAALACAFVALFTYEPTIAIFALFWGYLAVWRARGFALSPEFLRLLAVGTALELIFFFAVRHFIIAQGAPFNSLAVIFRNAIAYGVALVLPVDFLLLHVIFGTPLPSQVRLDSTVLGASIAAAVCIVLLTAIAVSRSGVRARLRALDWALIAFLVGGMVIAVLPLLLFREHPSEHDLYLSAALYAALVSSALWRFSRSRVLYACVVLALAVSFAAGTWVRNQRVEQCAVIAKRILTNLPTNRWRTGEWHIKLATRPGQYLGETYGIYHDIGLHTLEVEETWTPGAQEAIQLATNNQRVAVRIVSADSILRDCNAPNTCFWISASGQVVDAIPVGGSHAFR